MSLSVYLVAAEPSGDLFAAEILRELKSLQPGLIASATGGDALADEGLASPIDISPLSVIGLVEGLKAYRDVVRLADVVAADILKVRPDVVLLVDSWGFNLRVAQRVRKAAPSIGLIKVIGPQVWATRPGRARTLADTVDHVFCIHAFEQPFYEGLDIQTHVIGNPALGRKPSGDAAAFRSHHDLTSGDQVITVLPGSRASEIRRVAPTLFESAARLQEANPGLKVIVAPGKRVASLIAPEDVSGLRDPILLTDEQEKFDAVAASDLILACSGTVATEVAMLGKPVMVGYRVGWITWAIARAFLYRPKYINLLNIAANDEVVPEFLQTRFSVENVVRAAQNLLENADVRANQIARQNKALELMGVDEPPPAKRAAEATLSITSKS